MKEKKQNQLNKLEGQINVESEFEITKERINEIVREGNNVLEKSEKEINSLKSKVLIEVLNSNKENIKKELIIENFTKKVDLIQNELNLRVFEAVKSWWVYVHNISKCYKCAYCILSSRKDLKEEGGFSNIESFVNREIGDVPSAVSGILKKIPVSLNNYFGDPLIQWKDTLSKIEKLEKAGHKGPVGIISKSYFDFEKARRLAKSKCRIVVLQSISNLPFNIEPVSHQKRIKSLINLVQAGVPTIAYLRPLIPGLNTFEDILRATLDDIAQTGCKILCYSGLRGTSDVLELLEKTIGKKVEPPTGFNEWQKDHKLIEKKVQNFIESYAKKLGLLVFRKTSCAVSYATGLESDYNCHWQQPEKFGCQECVMAEKCSRAVSNWEKSADQRIKDALSILGAEGTIEKKPKISECQLKDVCHFPCSSCPISGGIRLHLKGKWSLGELSVARWVAGIPVEADEIIDTPRIFHLYTETEKKEGEKKSRFKVNPKHFYRKPSESACPQGCAYCIVDLNPERKKEYEEGIEYFMNSFVAINLPLRNREKHLEQLKNFDFTKVKGDIIGFQGASEPLLFPKELDFICQKAREFNFRVAICTKANISPEKALDLFNRYGDVLDVEVSYAKLTELERTDKYRLMTIKNLKEAGLDPLVVIQPFIYGLTDRRFKELLKELKSVGVKWVCVNGFRYSRQMEEWAKEILPSKWLKAYQNHEGEEWLPYRDKIIQEIKKAGFEYVKISEWLQRNKRKPENPPSIEKINDEIKTVKELMKIPKDLLTNWYFKEGKIIIKGKEKINLLKLRVASDSSSECLEKTLSRRLNWPVKLE